MLYNIFSSRCPLSMIFCPVAASTASSAVPWWTAAVPGESLDDYLRSVGASLWPGDADRGHEGQWGLVVSVAQTQEVS
eukprot:2374042-Amphidinium_carterae.4